MAMLQFYYTSCSRGISGGAGFQYKAMSPGISAEDLSLFNSLIGFLQGFSLRSCELFPKSFDLPFCLICCLLELRLQLLLQFCDSCSSFI